MTLTQITDHSDQAVDRLHQKHRDLPNIEALVRLLVDPMQDIETALWELWTERLIDTAIGEQLNVLGRVVGQVRNGLSDADYRRHIRARISVNKSKGLWSDLIIVARLVLNEDAAVLVMSESNYMTVLMEVTEVVVSDSDAAILIDFLQQTKSDVVRLLLTYSAQAAVDTFTLGSVQTMLGPFVGPTMAIGTLFIEVADTSGFEPTGSVTLEYLGANEEDVTYTVRDSQFFDISATTKTHTLNGELRTADSTTQGYEDDAAPGTGGKLTSVLV